MAVTVYYENDADSSIIRGKKVAVRTVGMAAMLNFVGRRFGFKGILILAVPSVRRLLDVRLFVDTDSDVRLIRRIRRDLTERGTCGDRRN